jgi:hypothetical protein
VIYSNLSRFSVAAGRAAITGFLLAVGLLLSAPSQALDETKADLRLSVSDDYVHARGSMVVSARYGGAWGARLGFWARESHVESSKAHYFAGIDYVWTYSKWRAGLGAVWIDQVNELNGTHLDSMSRSDTICRAGFSSNTGTIHTDGSLGSARTRPTTDGTSSASGSSFDRMSEHPSTRVLDKPSDPCCGARPSPTRLMRRFQSSGSTFTSR